MKALLIGFLAVGLAAAVFLWLLRDPERAANASSSPEIGRAGAIDLHGSSGPARTLAPAPSPSTAQRGGPLGGRVTDLRRLQILIAKSDEARRLRDEEEAAAMTEAARAAAKTAEVKDRTLLAQKAYDDAIAAYRAKHYEEGADLFLQAYAHMGNAEFIYNAAIMYQKMGDCADAIYYFGRYLEEAPSAKDHDEVSKRIAQLTVGACALEQKRQ